MRGNKFLVGALALISGLTLGAYTSSPAFAASSREVAPAESSQAAPKLLIETPVYDFGSVIQGTQVGYNFILKNSGNAPLSIRRVHPACGCTAATPASTTILPGEQTTLGVIFDTNGFQGYKVKTVRVYTNDPAQSSTILTIQGTVKRDVDIDPPRLYFGSVNKGREQSRVVTVSLEKGSAIKVGEITSRSEQLDISVVDSGDGLSKKITAKLKSSVPAGIFRTFVVVKTTSTKNPVINIPVFARVQGDLKLEPADVSFGLLEGPLAEPAVRRVKLINQGSQKINVLSVTSDNPGLKVDFQANPDASFDLVVTLSEGVSGTLKARVKILTDHPDDSQKEIILPVYGIVSTSNQNR